MKLTKVSMLVVLALIIVSSCSNTKSNNSLRTNTIAGSGVSSSSSSSSSTSTGSKTKVIISFGAGSIFQLQGPDNSRFKGHVSIDKDKKGILIIAGDGAQNESMLRLVSDKIDENTYLIDYRLMRSCNFPIKFSKNAENFELSFSPKSLENRNKNKNFMIKVEVFKYKTLLPKVENVKEYLKNQCSNRKSQIENLKNNFAKTIMDYQNKYHRIHDINNRLMSINKDTENLKISLNDSENQLKDIKNLKDSYKNQISNLSTLSKGSDKLIKMENDRISQMYREINENKKQVQKKESKILESEEKEKNSKESYTNIMEKIKKISSKISSDEKELNEVTNKLSEQNQNKLKTDIDLKMKDDKTIYLKKLIATIKDDLNKLSTKETKIKQNYKKSLQSQKSLQNNINKQKSDMEQLDEEIKKIYMKRVEIQNSMRDSYDQLNTTTDEVSRLNVEQFQISTAKAQLSQKKSMLKSQIQEETNSKPSKNNKDDQFSDLINGYKEKSRKIKQSISKNEKLKESLENSLDQTKGNTEKIINRANDLNKEKFGLERKINNMQISKKNQEEKLKVMISEKENYLKEIDNINQSLKVAEQTNVNASKLVEEFRNKYNPMIKERKSMNSEKTQIQRDSLKFKQQITQAATKLRIETPAASVLLDLAEDEAYNYVKSFDKDNKMMRKNLNSIPKWRKLIEQLIY